MYEIDKFTVTSNAVACPAKKDATKKRLQAPRADTIPFKYVIQKTDR